MKTLNFIFLSIGFILLFTIGLFSIGQDYHALIASLIFLIIGLLLIFFSDFKIKKILFLAFLFRSLAAIISYTEYNFLWINVFPLEGSTTNAVYFHEEAFKIYSNGILDLFLNFSTYVSNFYSLFISLIYFIFGPYNIIPILINVIFGVLIVYRIFLCCLLLFNDKIAKISAIFASFSPWMIIFCSTLLREAMITYCVLSTVYFLFKYYKNNKLKYLMYIFLYSVINILLHGALFGVFLMIFLIIIFIHRKNINNISSFSKILLSFLIPIILFSFFSFSGFTIYKLETIFEKNSTSQILDSFLGKSGNIRETSSKLYRDKVDINSFPDLIISLPKVTFPFLFKPYPTQLLTWRYPLHYIHSMLMYFFVFLFISNFRNIINRKILKYLFLIILANLIIFSFGTSNINAAIRHIHKFIPLIIILLSQQIYNFKRRIFS